MKLHLGCGQRYIKGFVHVDLSDYPHIDYRHDIRTLPMFADETVDLIYACHVIEYFDRIEVIDILAEWRRVLMPGGILRLAVPDFAALVEIYQKQGDLSPILGPLFGRWLVDSEHGENVVYHRTVYDYPSLSALLKSNGFSNVHRYDWRDTIHKDYDDYSQAYIPHMDKDNGLLISLNIEAGKS